MEIKMKFTKMHGLGNDYLYVYGEVPENIRELSIRLSDRHFGAGSDGMIYISPSEKADFKMRIFNADGSEARMCGNGIRCVGKYVYDRGYTEKTHLEIETLSGVKYLDLFVSDGIVGQVSVNMGQATPGNPLMLEYPGASAITELSSPDGCDFLHFTGENMVQIPCTPVDVGNPHAVIFTGNAETVPLKAVGPLIEHHPQFPDGVNVEFVQKAGENALRMRVWERGSGVTMACGTGACASVRAAVQKGFCSYDTPVSVRLDGGTLKVEVKKDGTVIMTGPAAFVYDGECPD